MIGQASGVSGALSRNASEKRLSLRDEGAGHFNHIRVKYLRKMFHGLRKRLSGLRKGDEFGHIPIGNHVLTLDQARMTSQTPSP